MAKRITSLILATVVVAVAVASCGSSRDTAEEIRNARTEVAGQSQRLAELDSKLSNTDSNIAHQAQIIEDMVSRLEAQENAALPQSLVVLATEISSLSALYTDLSRSLSALPRDQWIRQRLELVQTSTLQLADLLAGEDIIEHAIAEFGLPLAGDYSNEALKVELEKAVSSLQVIRDDLQDGLQFESAYGFAPFGVCPPATEYNAELCTYFSIESIRETLEGQPISEGAEILVVFHTHSLLTKVNVAFDALLN